ncbi:hypothetical protein NC651_004044 [Populus alba x Populus x berolinensis]|nr:hypothetical protein NC651_004044 [Populus alba x Populus x berolinensis]
MEQEGRDLRDLAMEDWTESTRWEEFIEELMVIDEAGGSQGQGVYEGMLDTENLTHSRTVEGIELIDQGADVSDGGRDRRIHPLELSQETIELKFVEKVQIKLGRDADSLEENKALQQRQSAKCEEGTEPLENLRC